MSSVVQRALIAVIVLLLGAGVVGALSVQSGDDGEPSALGTTSTTEGDDGTATTTTSAGATSTTVAPSTTATAGAASGGTGSGGTGSGAGAGGSGSGLGTSGSGEVASGNPTIADTGAETLLVPGAFAAFAAIALRRSVNRTR